MRGYIQQLAEANRQPGILGQIAIGAGQAAGGLLDFQRQEEARKTKEAQDRLGIVQKVGQIAVENGDGSTAAALGNQMPGLLKQGYGIDVPNRQVIGEPIMARGMERPFIEHKGPSPVPGQLVGVPSPTLQPTPYVYDTGNRNLNNPRSLDASRQNLLIAKPKAEWDLKSVDPTHDLYRTGPDGKPQLVRAGTPRSEKVDPLLDLRRRTMEADLANKLNPKQPKDNSQQEYQRAFSHWQERGAAYVNDYVSLMARNSQRTKQTPSGIVTVPPTPEQLAQWRKDGEALYRNSVAPPMPPGGVGKADPFANPTSPGGPQAKPAGNLVRPIKAQRSRVPVPEKYEDVDLLPEFEAHAQEALKLAPGTRISSRARSEKRNAEAGGAEDSWHKHRQAFDLVGAKPAQKAALKAWASSKGLWMLDEGDHLHFQPIQGVSAETAPKMAAFYERHGITPGEA
jgi:hypothetical protein